MRWSKQNKELIKKTIADYRKDLEKKKKDREYFKGMYWCHFCRKYGDSCVFCPNTIINKILAIEDETDRFFIFMPPDCITNNEYIGSKSNKDEGTFDKSPSNIRLRIKFWESALNDNKKEFIKKWKKVENND